LSRSLARKKGPLDEKPPPLEHASVEALVGNAHGDLSEVQTLLDAEPMLVNAAWDWGGGDWETGLAAAAHMGRRDIAEFLISRGARIDIFAAAMLGWTEVVRSMLDACPELIGARGPTGYRWRRTPRKVEKTLPKLLPFSTRALVRLSRRSLDHRLGGSKPR
jgi:hypothetical protein